MIIDHHKMLRLPSLCFIVVAAGLSLQFTVARSAEKEHTCTSPANIEESCKAIGQKNPDIALDFCVSSLNAAAKTMHSADSQQELAAATTRLAITHAQSTESKIDELMDLETDPTAKKCYNECIDAYTENIDLMRDAVDNISTQVYGKALSHLKIALKAVDKCEEVFKGANLPSPLGAVDRDYSKLANIALGLLLSIK